MLSGFSFFEITRLVIAIYTNTLYNRRNISFFRTVLFKIFQFKRCSVIKTHVNNRLYNIGLCLLLVIVIPRIIC